MPKDSSTRRQAPQRSRRRREGPGKRCAIVRVAFLGNWALGWAALAGLLTLDPPVEVVGVWTLSDPRNRVLETARRLSLPMPPFKLMRDGGAGAAALREARPDLALMANFHRILGDEALRAPRLGVINLHPSLLPRHRGAAPVRWTILAGDVQAGVTALRADGGIDSGAIVAAEAFAVGADDDYTRLITRLAACMPDLVRRVVAMARDDRVEAIPQDERLATLAPRLEESDWRLRWDYAADALGRRIRAGYPPGAWFAWNDRIVRVRKAEVVAASGPPGTVLENGAHPVIAAADGALRLKRHKWWVWPANAEDSSGIQCDQR